MRRKSGISVAASVARQAASRSLAVPSNVVSLPEPTKPATRIDTGVTEKGAKPFLRAVFPKPEKGGDATVELTFLLEFPALSHLLSKAFLHAGLNLGERSRTELAAELRRGLCDFLRKRGSKNVNIDDLSSSFFQSFVADLNKPRKNGEPLAHGSRQTRLGVIRTLLAAALETSRGSQSHAIRKARENIPANCWPGSHLKIKHRERLSRDHLIAIIEACEREIQAIDDRMKRGEQLIKEGRCKIEAGDTDPKDLAVALAKLSIMYPADIPFIDDIRKVDAYLADVLSWRHGILACERFLYASTRDLIPFALLLAVATVFNADTILMLNRSDFTRIERFGEVAYRITGRKGRAHSDPVILAAGQSGEIGIENILQILEALTSRIRPRINLPHTSDRLFISMVRFYSEKFVKGFEVKTGGGTNDVSWKQNLESFIKENNLEYFTLAQIRPTLIDEVVLVTGDVMAGRQVGFHRNVQTTWFSYTSSGTKRRFRERVGEILLLRERWHSTGGVIDPRGRGARHDTGAATPGFLCFDPFDSPMPNQHRGRLCTAYGACPSCPLAAANVSDVSSVTLYYALEKAILAAQGPISPEGWTTRWAPVLRDLQELLTHVPGDIKAKSMALCIRLPLPTVG